MGAHKRSVFIKFKDVRVNVKEILPWGSGSTVNETYTEGEHVVQGHSDYTTVVLEIPKEQKFFVSGGCVVIPAGEGDTFTKVYLSSNGQSVDSHKEVIVKHKDDHVGDPDL